MEAFTEILKDQSLSIKNRVYSSMSMTTWMSTEIHQEKKWHGISHCLHHPSAFWLAATLSSTCSNSQITTHETILFLAASVTSADETVPALC